MSPFLIALSAMTFFTAMRSLRSSYVNSSSESSLSIREGGFIILVYIVISLSKSA
jgi:hypothetical protein